MYEAALSVFLILVGYGIYWLSQQPPSDFPGGDGT